MATPFDKEFESAEEIRIPVQAEPYEISVLQAETVGFYSLPSAPSLKQRQRCAFLNEPSAGIWQTAESPTSERCDKLARLYQAIEERAVEIDGQLKAPIAAL